uniref:Ammonium_transp domain-containing protein n=1 Tax=Syphacia muris TaxID=451379 RepID=A0A0N5AJM8_9BILA
MASLFHKHQFGILITAAQILFFVLIGIFGEYDSKAMPRSSGSEIQTHDYVNSMYPLFQDVHVMMFIGFGFLMTFLRRYGYSAVSVNMLLSCLVIQWGIIVRGFWSEHFAETGKFVLNIESLLTADFAAAVVLITMGAMLGKLSPAQYVVMAFVETAVALTTEHIVVEYFKANDVGGSMIVHTFGAYFGLACAKTFNKKEMVEHEHEGSSYNSDIFSMIGAIFLWVFWPSFNAAIATPEDARHRAIINTYLSLCACTLVTFMISQLTDPERKMRFSMVHIANSTLAGGVAIGTTANVVLHPLHALLVGAGAAVISVLGYAYLTPFMAKKLGIHDTCGVNNLHGMPGVYAGILGFIFAAVYDPARYSTSLGDIYPAMVSNVDGEARSSIIQACFQLAGLALVLGCSLVSGAVTGLILRLKLWNQVREKEYYSDGDYFETPADYDFTTRIISKIDHIELTEHTSLTNKEH